MAEYIEREALIKRLEVTPLLRFGIPSIVRDGVIDLAKKQPAADVVEVCRCRDCTYYENNWCGFWEEYPETGENDFCSNGKKRAK